jgi:O-antigen ligase
MIISDSKARGWLRFLGALALVPLLLTAFESGSRAGLLAIVVGCLYLMWTFTWAQRVKIVAAGFVLVAVVVATSPTNVLMERINGTGASEGSTDARIELLKDSLVLTARNPIFGVGPGMFPVAQNDLAKSEGGVGGRWHVTHNTYTELSSEAGLPALVLFLMIFYSFYRDLRRLGRLNELTKTSRQGEIRAVCTGSLVTLVSFAACLFFGSLAYSPMTLTIVGLLAAYSRTGIGELERVESFARAT